MKGWLLKGIVVMLGLILVAGGCAPKPDAGKQEMVDLEIYSTAGPGTPPYTVSLALSGMMNELHPRLRSTVIETLGSVDAIHTTNVLPPERKKSVFLCITTGVSMAEAWQGLAQYKRKFTDMKLVASTGKTGFTFITYDSNIKTPKDLAGKRLTLQLKTMPLYPLGEALLRDAWGILDQVKISDMAPTGTKDYLVTGIVDAAFVAPATENAGGKFGIPPYVSEAQAARKTYWVEVSEEDVARVNENNPWTVSRVEVPTGAVGGGYPLEDTGVVAWYNYIVAWDVADEEVVYELVKFLDENAAEWSKRNRGLPSGAGYMGDFPGMTEDKIHPGALRYYKEKGIQVGG
ncbi:TAXI family TRAP transporter solute-binding subunit [Chloroflexota bacterium]